MSFEIDNFTVEAWRSDSYLLTWKSYNDSDFTPYYGILRSNSPTSGYEEVDYTSLEQYLDNDFNNLKKWREQYYKLALLKKRSDEIGSVRTLEEIEVASNKAKIYGSLDRTENENVEVFFKYRKIDSESWNETARNTYSSPTSFSFTINNLDFTAEYEYKAVSEYNGNINEGEIFSLVTYEDPKKLNIDSELKNENLIKNPYFSNLDNGLLPNHWFFTNTLNSNDKDNISVITGEKYSNNEIKFENIETSFNSRGIKTEEINIESDCDQLRVLSDTKIVEHESTNWFDSDKQEVITRAKIKFFDKNGMLLYEKIKPLNEEYSAWNEYHTNIWTVDVPSAAKRVNYVIESRKTNDAQGDISVVVAGNAVEFYEFDENNKKPTVTTLQPEVGQTSATLRAEVSNLPEDSNYQIYFEIEPQFPSNKSYTTGKQLVDDEGKFDFDIKKLESSKEYSVKAILENEDKKTSEAVLFTTDSYKDTDISEKFENNLIDNYKFNRWSDGLPTNFYVSDTVNPNKVKRNGNTSFIKYGNSSVVIEDIDTSLDNNSIKYKKTNIPNHHNDDQRFYFYVLTRVDNYTTPVSLSDIIGIEIKPEINFYDKNGFIIKTDIPNFDSKDFISVKDWHVFEFNRIIPENAIEFDFSIKARITSEGDSTQSPDLYLDAVSLLHFVNENENIISFSGFDVKGISDYAKIQSKPNAKTLEMARRNEMLIRNYTSPNANQKGSGEPCKVLKRINDGDLRCPECYDEDLGRRKYSDCERCNGTGWVEGYYDPIKSYIQFNPENKSSQITERGENEKSQTTARLSNFPIINPRDIIVEPIGDRRWRVVNVAKTERNRHLVSQNLSLREINEDQIEYDIEV